MDWWWTWRETAVEDATPMPASKAEFLTTKRQVWRGRRMARGLGLRPGMRVLDVGCGPGRFTLPFAERMDPDGEVVAVDRQEEMLGFVRQRADEWDLSNIRTVRASIGDDPLPFADDFDVAILVNVVGEIADRFQRDAFWEIHAALRPGGVLVVREHFLDPDYRSPGTIAALGESAGFDHIVNHRCPIRHRTFLWKE